MAINTRALFFNIKKRTLLIFGIILFIFSSLITITEGGVIVYNFFNKSIRQKAIFYENISRLATEVNITHFNSLLGNPAYINLESNLKEYIFVNDLFYVQGVTNSNDKVLAYSVTTRDRSFNPKVPFFEKVLLGKSNFKDINEYTIGSGQDPNWAISYLGAHDLFYTEGYYLANPGGYQSIFFSMTKSGYIDYEKYKIIPQYESENLALPWLEDSPTLSTDTQSKKDYLLEEKEFLDFRKENINTINTFTILGPFIAPKDLLVIRDGSPYYYLFGPEYNQVRLLN